LLPERAIGLAAHDFQQAMGAAEVTLSRARRAGEAETVASRWVNRLTGVLAGLPGADGPQALAAMRDRGRDRLAQAVRWQAPQARVAPALRPKIAPPAAARPARMAVTDIVRLVADPYAVYARRVLHLRPLDPLQPEPDPRTRGTLFHDILDRYARALTPDADRAALLATIAAARIADAVAWPLTRVLWQARFLDAVDGILAFDDAHPGDRVLTERKGQMEVWPGGSTLTARPDRIDMLADGRVHLIDYKGAAPEPRDIESHQKQLLLEAVIAHAGGFGTDLAGRAALTTYLGLNAPEKPRQQSLTADDIAAALAQLRALLQHYADPATGFAASRIAVKDQRGDYDDLARRGEWDLSDSPVLQQVGTAP
jgi:RecB family exonuclease